MQKYLKMPLGIALKSKKYAKLNFKFYPSRSRETIVKLTPRFSKKRLKKYANAAKSQPRQ